MLYPLSYAGTPKTDTFEPDDLEAAECTLGRWDIRLVIHEAHKKSTGRRLTAAGTTNRPFVNVLPWAPTMRASERDDRSMRK